MASHDDVEPKNFLYEWKSPERSELCEILNQNDHWEELAVQMKFGVPIIHKLRQRKNPTKELLEEWSHDNHTIEELFLLLSSMNHRRAMIRLKPFVAEKYHSLIKKYSDGIENYTQEKDLKIKPQNFHQIQPSPINNQKIFVDKKFEEEKILNVPPSDDIENNFVDTKPHEFSYEELTQATDNWSSYNILRKARMKFLNTEELTQATDNWSSYILGKGCFGTVFKGKWQKTKVAIRKIEQPKPDVTDDHHEYPKIFMMVLCPYIHDNILTLEGFSVGPEVTCLVYRLMANGSLEDCLFTKERNNHLTWRQRREIAMGTARGLQFLHTVSKKPLVHGDIKSANIFLDENYKPKIKEVALGKNSMDTSTKSDTHAFGLVLFELATGLPAYDNARPEFKYLIELIDDYRPEYLPFFKDEKAGTKDTQFFEEFITLGKWCTQILSENRPEMVEVFRKIDEL